MKVEGIVVESVSARLNGARLRSRELPCAMAGTTMSAADITGRLNRRQFSQQSHELRFLGVYPRDQMRSGIINLIVRPGSLVVIGEVCRFSVGWDVLVQVGNFIVTHVVLLFGGFVTISLEVGPTMDRSLPLLHSLAAPTSCGWLENPWITMALPRCAHLPI